MSARIPLVVTRVIHEYAPQTSESLMSYFRQLTDVWNQLDRVKAVNSGLMTAFPAVNRLLSKNE